ncbi:hypothetical protein HK104_000818 [Borealophlyctis nickersoniae]|nr:hypothetical protein HK104_000818 [Borealophlyctis nickersoniae]
MEGNQEVQPAKPSDNLQASEPVDHTLSRTLGRGHTAPWATSIPVIIFAHIVGMVGTLAPYLVVSNVPTTPMLNAGHKAAGWVWDGFNLIINCCYPISSPYWILTCLGLPFNWKDWRMYLPCVALAVACFVSYGIPIAMGKWPTPFTPIYGGGSLYNVFPPLVTYLLMPADLKKEDQFWKKFLWSATVPLCADMFWFICILYYLAIAMVDEVYRLPIIILFKFVTMLFIGAMISLLHEVIHRNQGHTGDPIRLGGTAKLLIDCSYEIYVFFTLSLIESWGAFGIYLAVEMAALTLELYHKQSSTAIAIFHVPLNFLRTVGIMKGPAAKSSTAVDNEKCEGKKDAKRPPAVLPPSAFDLHHGVHPNYPVDGAKIGTGAEQQKKDLSAEDYTRVVHYILSVHARVYGAIVVSLLLPTWYHGPNKEAYIFDFPPHELPTSIIKMWLSVLASFIHFGVASVYLKRTKHIDMIAIWKRMGVKFFGSFIATYLTAPIFPVSQMGKEWNTIWFLRKIGGLRMESHT